MALGRISENTVRVWIEAIWNGCTRNTLRGFYNWWTSMTLRASSRMPLRGDFSNTLPRKSILIDKNSSSRSISIYTERHKSFRIHTQRFAWLTLQDRLKPSIQMANTQFTMTLCIKWLYSTSKNVIVLNVTSDRKSLPTGNFKLPFFIK